MCPGIRPRAHQLFANLAGPNTHETVTGCVPMRGTYVEDCISAHSGAGEGAPIQPLIPLPVLVALVSRGLLAEALRVDEDEEDEG